MRPMLEDRALLLQRIDIRCLKGSYAIPQGVNMALAITESVSICT